jgi:hypothetical protein
MPMVVFVTKRAVITAESWRRPCSSLLTADHASEKFPKKLWTPFCTGVGSTFW